MSFFYCIFALEKQYIMEDIMQILSLATLLLGVTAATIIAATLAKVLVMWVYKLVSGKEGIDYGD